MTPGLLCLCAFLAQDDIPEQLLSQGEEHLPESLAATVNDAIAIDNAIATLRRYSDINATPPHSSPGRLWLEVAA